MYILYIKMKKIIVIILSLYHNIFIYNNLILYQRKKISLKKIFSLKLILWMSFLIINNQMIDLIKSVTSYKWWKWD